MIVSEGVAGERGWRRGSCVAVGGGGRVGPAARAWDNLDWWMDIITVKITSSPNDTHVQYATSFVVALLRGQGRGE